ncbi:hypothetical protein CR513_46992, partial [Mucuna pruriens]
MEANTSFSEVASPIFDGENYDFWALRMESYWERPWICGKLWNEIMKCLHYLTIPPWPSECNQMGYEATICKTNIQPATIEAKNAQEEEDDQLFVATCFSSNSTYESWLIDSGCINHGTYDKELFKQLVDIKVKLEMANTSQEKARKQ